jgi:hypothetical protein
MDDMHRVPCEASINPTGEPWTHVPLVSIVALFAISMAVLSPQRAFADEGGVSYWLPGSYGSLAAVPGEPGWSFATFNYYGSVSAQKSVEFSRGGGIQSGVSSRTDFQYLDPTYVFATPVLGGQASLGLGGLLGPNTTSVFGTLTGPGGGSVSGGRSDSIIGIGDLYPTASLRWNQGVNNYMTYLTGDIPVGAYDPNRLANLGIGHGAIDAGGGYTYFDPVKGHEFSVVVGATYNFINPTTHYQNGVDAHLDWGASQFLSQQLQVGAVGYVYQQLTGDSGSGDKLGPFKSRVIGIGPQIGYLFPAGGMQGYVNLKAYGEFDAHDRPSGWNVWLTLSISPAAPAPATPIVTKY